MAAGWKRVEKYAHIGHTVEGSSQAFSMGCCWVGERKGDRTVLRVLLEQLGAAGLLPKMERGQQENSIWGA